MSLPACLMAVGASPPASAAGAGVDASGAGAAADAAAGAAAGAGDVACANAGALVISASAPTRAMIGVVRFVSSIFRQFLVDQARWAQGSSRQSVTSLHKFLSDEPENRPARRDFERLSRPGNPLWTDPHSSGALKMSCRRSETTTALPLCQNCGPRSFRNPSPMRQGDSTAVAQVSREVYSRVKSLDLPGSPVRGDL